MRCVCVYVYGLFLSLVGDDVDDEGGTFGVGEGTTDCVGSDCGGPEQRIFCDQVSAPKGHLKTFETLHEVVLPIYSIKVLPT